MGVGGEREGKIRLRGPGRGSSGNRVLTFEGITDRDDFLSFGGGL